MTPGVRPWAACYGTVLDRLMAIEAHHDAIEAEAFRLADDELCAALDACPSSRADELREARVALLVLHARWQSRRAGLVAADPEKLAAALTATEGA